MAKKSAKQIAARGQTQGKQNVIGGGPLAYENTKGSDTGPPAMAIQGQTPKEAAKAARTAGKASGLKGKTLKDSIKAAKQTASDAQTTAATGDLNLSPEMGKYIKRPKKFMKNLMQGKGPAFKKLTMLQQASKDLGYTQDQNKMQSYVGQQYDENGQPIVNEHTDVTPQGTQWANAVGSRIGADGHVEGMTPQESAAFFAEQADPVRATAQQNYSNEQEREASAGIDPRSGIAASNAQAIGAKTQGALAEAGRQTQLEDVARQKDWEGYAGDLSKLQESARSEDVNADVTKSGQNQTGLTNLAQLGENQRQFDVTYTEGQRQAAQRRADAKQAAKDATPSGMEKAAAGLSGVLGGLSMGGGGGGASSMMGGK